RTWISGPAAGEVMPVTSILGRSSTRSPRALAAVLAAVGASPGVSGKRGQGAAGSAPQNEARWGWRIVDYAGEGIEESRGTFATIGSAVEHGSKRLKQLDVVDNSVPSQCYRSTRHRRVR